MAFYITFFLIITTSFIHHRSRADPRADIVARTCNTTRVVNPEKYRSTYQSLATRMKQDMFTSKYSYAKEEVAQGNEMYVFSQCMNDLSREDCRTCFSLISDLMLGCLPSTGGRVYFDGCFMRYENYSFLHADITGDFIKRCSPTVDYTLKNNNLVKEVLNTLKAKAQLNQGYADHKKSSHGVSVYGSAICFKNLEPNMCSLCLSFAVENALKCLPSAEGRALLWGCYLRYSDYEFVNNHVDEETQEKTLVKIAFFFGVIAICLLAIWIGLVIGQYTFKLKEGSQDKATGEKKESTMFKRSLPFLQFKYPTLEKATESFNADHRLGQGGFGEVFRGTLPDGREIAVKRLFTSGKFQTEDIYNEMDVINRARHKNLVIFLGCCFTNRDSYLVYEFLPNKSLDCILFVSFVCWAWKKDSEKKKDFDWKKRLGIITGIAEGLEYLHKHCQVRIVHRDIKASNVLLDAKFKPKIADFGLARFNSCSQSLTTTAIAGTLGYMAPEYLSQGRLTEKVDVYSFGVLVLEIISGIQSTKFQSDDALETVVTTAWKHFQSNTVSELIDKSLEIDNAEEITRIIQIGLLCSQESPTLRPTMTSVIEMLQQQDEELPKPTKPPFTEESMECSKSLGSSLRRPPSISSNSNVHKTSPD